MSKKILSLTAGGVCVGMLALASASGAAVKGALSPGDSVFDNGGVAAAAPACDDNSDCGGPNRYCAKPAGDCDGPGVCKRRPQICQQVYAPVCGCDGQTYGNKCLAAAAGVNVAFEGECPQICGGITGIPCDDPDEFCKTAPGECCCDFFGECTPIPDACPDVWDPVCGCDGVTYGNECEADAAGVSVDHEGECGGGGALCGGITGIPCEDPNEFCKTAPGECCCDFFGECTPIPQGCPDVWDPVCGCDGVTYSNECDADAAGVSVDHAGECDSGGALCGGFTGIPCENPNEFCKTAPGECCCDFFGECTPIPLFCPLIYDPVCGCDGQTYTNECFADSAGVSVDFPGPCEGAPGECQTNADCFLVNYPFSSYCAKPVGQCDGPGECQVMPQLCLDVWDPVCGCDGQIYSNACYAAAAGVNLSSDGACAQ